MIFFGNRKHKETSHEVVIKVTELKKIIKIHKTPKSKKDTYSDSYSDEEESTISRISRDSRIDSEEEKEEADDSISLKSELSHIPFSTKSSAESYYTAASTPQAARKHKIFIPEEVVYEPDFSTREASSTKSKFLKKIQKHTIAHRKSEEEKLDHEIGKSKTSSAEEQAFFHRKVEIRISSNDLFRSDTDNICQKDQLITSHSSALTSLVGDIFKAFNQLDAE